MTEIKNQQPVLALGLMSGTSMDGVDAALLWTDGEGIAEPRGTLSISYDKRVSGALRATVARAEMLPGVDAVEREMYPIFAPPMSMLAAKARRSCRCFTRHLRRMNPGPLHS